MAAAFAKIPTGNAANVTNLMKGPSLFAGSAKLQKKSPVVIVLPMAVLKKVNSPCSN